jgi:steroid 5-alpha reductase family enzyme
MSTALVASNATLVAGLMTALWIVSVFRRDASLVDPWWSIAFLLVVGHTVLATGFTPGKALLLAVVAIWALRLWVHLLWRSRGKPEDPRYAAFRQRYGPTRYWWISFFQVYLLQAVLIVFISAPLQLAASASGPVGPATVVGLVLFAVGFVIETIADRQLQAFRDDPARRGQVLATGLWRLSRHPNYFGEALLWWGFGCMALAQPYGWVCLLGPVAMTFLLLRVSGVVMLDAHLTATKPAYRDYMQRTSAFVLWPPRA